MKRVEHCALFVLLVLTLASSTVHAITITDNLYFESSNQSMWSEGNAAEWGVETFLGAQWGTYAGGSAVNKSIGLDVGVASVRAGIKSSGEIGIIPWASASGGGVSISLPSTVTLPDFVSPNSYFKVSTSNTIQSTALIDTQAPSFNAGIDGLFNMDNKLYGEAATFAGCGTFGTSSCEWDGDVDVSLKAGRFSLLEFDTTQDDPLSIFGINVPVGFDRQYDIHVPGGPTFIYNAETSEHTRPFTPIVGDIEISRLEDKSGGTLNDSQLSLTTNQDIFKGSLSITGVLETLLGSPGVLRNDITVFENSIKDIKAGYVLADVSTGPILGMQQSFDFDPNLVVRLAFDKPVTRLEYIQVGSHTETREIFSKICLPFPLNTYYSVKIGEETITVEDYDWVPVTYDDGIIEILLGEEADLKFGNGFANLLSFEYILSDPTFSNQTFATIDPFLEVEALCASFTGIGRTCVYDEIFRTEGLAAMEVYSNEWVMSGFDSYTIDMNGKGPIEVVPEPSTVLLLGSGMAGLAWCRRKRKKA